MKHKWTNNLGLKIVSLLVSCLIWVVVTNTNDPESTQVYKNVPITIKNQDTITNANKTFTVVDGVDKINVYVTARKSVRSSLAADSFIVKRIWRTIMRHLEQFHWRSVVKMEGSDRKISECFHLP